VRVDPAELELALLNIGVNARDAMPNGGRLEIGARNISFAPDSAGNEKLIGDFVALKLSDNGSGMSAEVHARAFEPFFTTKEIGLGSGLGLSQVYGFAKQSGGAVLIDSEIGKGTTIALYLPRANASAVTRHSASADDVPVVAPTRILVVEDDHEVAEVNTQLLQDIGCSAVQVHDGKSALALLDRDPTIGLMLSDIVMPGGMNGIELAQIVRERRPDLPILLVTGHSQHALQLMSGSFTLLEKPYDRNTLAAAIRVATEAASNSHLQSAK